MQIQIGENNFKKSMPDVPAKKLTFMPKNLILCADYVIIVINFKN